MSVYVKICGITNPADAVMAANLGADALGFVFYPKSPRYIAPEDAGAVIRALPPFTARVGVFVNESERSVIKTVHRCGLTAVQLSGDEPARFLADAPFPIIRAVRVRERGDIGSHPAYRPGATFVLDSWRPGSFGGTGVPFDWDLIGDELVGCRIIIAGGLTPENVGAAVDRFRPFGVDVASGVEKSPGIKDHEKLRRFIRIAKKQGEDNHA